MHLAKKILLVTLCIGTVTGCSTINSERAIGHKIGEGSKAMLNHEFERSEKCYDEALQLIDEEETKKTITPSIANYSKALTLSYKGLLYKKESKPDDAIKNFETAKQLFEGQKSLTPSAKKIFAENLRAYASLLKEKDKPEEAAKLDDQAAKLD